MFCKKSLKKMTVSAIIVTMFFSMLVLPLNRPLKAATESTPELSDEDFKTINLLKKKYKWHRNSSKLNVWGTLSLLGFVGSLYSSYSHRSQANDYEKKAPEVYMNFMYIYPAILPNFNRSDRELFALMFYNNNINAAARSRKNASGSDAGAAAFGVFSIAFYATSMILNGVSSRIQPGNRNRYGNNNSFRVNDSVVFDSKIYLESQNPGFDMRLNIHF